MEGPPPPLPPDQLRHLLLAFHDKNITNIIGVVLNKEPITNKEAANKKYADDELKNITFVKTDKDNEFNEINLTNSDCILINRTLTANNEKRNKIYVDDIIGKATVVRFDQTLQLI